MEARQCVIDGVLTRIHTMNLPDLVDRPDLIDGLHTSGGQGSQVQILSPDSGSVQVRELIQDSRIGPRGCRGPPGHVCNPGWRDLR